MSGYDSEHYIYFFIYTAILLPLKVVLSFCIFTSFFCLVSEVWLSDYVSFVGMRLFIFVICIHL